MTDNMTSVEQRQYPYNEAPCDVGAGSSRFLEADAEHRKMILDQALMRNSSCEPHALASVHHPNTGINTHLASHLSHMEYGAEYFASTATAVSFTFCYFKIIKKM